MSVEAGTAMSLKTTSTESVVASKLHQRMAACPGLVA
jgi:hypothetical protein